MQCSDELSLHLSKDDRRISTVAQKFNTWLANIISTNKETDGSCGSGKPTTFAELLKQVLTQIPMTVKFKYLLEHRAKYYWKLET